MIAIRDKESGTVIEECTNLITAYTVMQDFIREDMANSEYTPNFYEISTDKGIIGEDGYPECEMFFLSDTGLYRLVKIGDTVTLLDEDEAKVVLTHEEFLKLK